MKPNPTRSALLVIDMENGFVHPEGGHWIRFAQSMVPNCVRAVELARAKGIPVFFVKRLYRADGSDVELTRYPGWVAGGRACRPASTGPNSAQAPEGLRPQPGDYTIIKPRWSAFFQTELDLILRRLDVRTVILTGTTTPNCIRTTCYDAIALEYNTVVLTDCCSSHTEEIQRVNLEDMARAGAILMDSASFADYGPGTVEDLSAAIRARVTQARARQSARFGPDGPTCNAAMGQEALRRWCALDPEGQALMKGAYERMGLTARSYDRILRVARTIADLDGAAAILAHHLAEAIQYRESDYFAS